MPLVHTVLQVSVHMLLLFYPLATRIISCERWHYWSALKHHSRIIMLCAIGYDIKSTSSSLMFISSVRLRRNDLHFWRRGDTYMASLPMHCSTRRHCAWSTTRCSSRGSQSKATYHRAAFVSPHRDRIRCRRLLWVVVHVTHFYRAKLTCLFYWYSHFSAALSIGNPFDCVVMDRERGALESRCCSLFEARSLRSDPFDNLSQLRGSW